MDFIRIYKLVIRITIIYFEMDRECQMTKGIGAYAISLPRSGWKN